MKILCLGAIFVVLLQNSDCYNFFRGNYQQLRKPSSYPSQSRIFGSLDSLEFFNPFTGSNSIKSRIKENEDKIDDLLFEIEKLRIKIEDLEIEPGETF